MNNKNKFLIIILIVILAVISLIYFSFNNNDETYEDVYISDNELVKEPINNSTEDDEIEKIKIHIIGEINKPGIYELSSGARIQDAIIAANGETSNADLNKVNLAYELEDGQKIYIPSIFEEETAYIYNDGGENVVIQDETASNNGKININKASVQELQEINGVGPSLAEKIITYREENGKFKNIEELNNVSGIGEKKYETIKEYVTVK